MSFCVFGPWFPSPQKFWLLTLWSLCCLDPSLQAPLAPISKAFSSLVSYLGLLASVHSPSPHAPLPLGLYVLLAYWVVVILAFLASVSMPLWPSAPLAPISMPLCPSSPHLYALLPL